MFRDETHTVVAKLTSSPPKKAQAARDLTCYDGTNDSSPGDAQQVFTTSLDAVALFNTLKLDEEKGLVDFFANNFTCTGSLANRSNLFWVPTNFVDLLKDNTTHISVQCVGAMALARLQRSAYYLREAQRMYSTAVISLNKRWNEGKSHNEESVFLAVLFLAFFEVLACYDPSSRQSWVTHLGGIGALFQTCSHQFLTSDFSVRMLLQSRSQVIMFALQTKTPVTGRFADTSLPIRRAIPAHLKPSDDLDILLIRLTDLQAQAKSPLASGGLVNDLIILEGDLSHWPRDLPPSWSFSKQACKLPFQYWWEARCDFYPTVLIANGWNKYRAARIIVHDLIHETSPHDTFPLPQPADRCISPSFEDEQLVTDLCATVPLHYRPTTSHAFLRKSEGDRPVLGTTYWLLWVLEVVGSMREAPAELTCWVVQCFERIHEMTGIAVAQRVAGRLKRRLESPNKATA